MKKKMIYDFHTHIKDIELLLYYEKDNIKPVVNCQSKEEYIKFKTELYSVGIHPHDSEIIEERFGNSYENLVKQSKIVGKRECFLNFTFRFFIISI